MRTYLPAVEQAVADLKLSEPFCADIRVVGNEKTPVIIVDAPIESTESLRHFAMSRATFEYDGRHAYPGVRTPLPPEYSTLLLPELATLIADIYQPPPSAKLKLVHQLFSLITLRPEELMPLQCAPHFDTHEPYYFATVHYLNPGTYAGTGFFRHRPTGFERISEERFPRFSQAAAAHVQQHGWPGGKYINASDDHFELIAEVDYRPNRLIIYPGNLLHSGLIDPDRDISADPATGRLTANLFLYFP